MSDDFVRLMLESAKKKETTLPQSRIHVDPDIIKEKLQQIQNKIQKR